MGKFLNYRKTLVGKLISKECFHGNWKLIQDRFFSYFLNTTEVITKPNS